MIEKRQATILVVDDEAANIHLLTEILQYDYAVLAVKSGERALKKAEESPPDLILLDVMMPGMDGFEVCRRLKEHSLLQGIPVIFVTALGDQVDEQRGFEAGGVDYIVKPVSPPIVQARVATHLRLKATEMRLRATLQQTLAGTTSLLTDLLSLANPVAYNRATRLSLYVKLLKPRLEQQDFWQFQLAAMLSQIGCLTIAPEVLEKAVRSEQLPEEEQLLIAAHPKVACQYVARIPQLENVAAIIASQTEGDAPALELTGLDHDVIRQGTSILRMVMAYDSALSSGLDPKLALGRLRANKRAYGENLVAALEEGLQANAQGMEWRRISAHMLKPGYILTKDALSTMGKLLLSAGTELSEPMVGALQRAAATGQFEDFLEVLVPCQDLSSFSLMDELPL